MKTPLALLAAAAVFLQDPDPVHRHRNFLPLAKYPPVQGKQIMVLAGDTRDVCMVDCRSSSPDAMCLSADGSSYRWAYVPVEKDAQFGQKAAGLKGESRDYLKLAMANPERVKRWGVRARYSLVEVEIADGIGNPGGTDALVATSMTVLDGSAGFPLKVDETVADLRKKYEAFLKEREAEIEAALEKARLSVSKDRKATGPRESSTITYVTWKTDTSTLEVRFYTRTTDGVYSYVTGGAAPPPGTKPSVRIGKEWAATLGRAYDVDKTGALEKTRDLPLDTFARDLPPPPMAPGGPR